MSLMSQSLNLYRQLANHKLFNKKIKFGHSKFYQLPNDILLIGSYHPSPRNVNTGRININKMTSLFKKIEKII